MTTKWSITEYYSRKLPDGQAFPPTDRKNPGSGEYVADPDGLQRLVEDHGENMAPLQVVAVFILTYIHLLAFPNRDAHFKLTMHHGLPVGDDCNGADIRENKFLIMENIHFLWHFLLYLLFREQSHVYSIDGFISGLGVTWKELESPTVLFGELARVLPSLEAKGVVIPENIRAFADQAISENAIVDMIQAAKEAARKLMSIAKMGNQNAVGKRSVKACISQMGNTNGRGNKGNTRPDMIGNKLRAIHQVRWLLC